MKCIYCNKEFKTREGLNAHQNGCYYKDNFFEDVIDVVQEVETKQEVKIKQEVVKLPAKKSKKKS